MHRLTKVKYLYTITDHINIFFFRSLYILYNESKDVTIRSALSTKKSWFRPIHFGILRILTYYQ